MEPSPVWRCITRPFVAIPHTPTNHSYLARPHHFLPFPPAVSATAIATVGSARLHNRDPADHRAGLLGQAADTQLAVLVAPPALDPAPVEDRARVPLPRCDGGGGSAWPGVGGGGSERKSRLLISSCCTSPMPAHPRIGKRTFTVLLQPQVAVCSRHL